MTVCGKIYAVGIGPGDPELLTLKAVRVLRECRHIAVPRGRQEGESLALSIIGKAVGLGGKNILNIHFPMVKDLRPEALAPVAAGVLDILKKDEDVAFVTLGDPTLYSTFFRLYDALLAIEPAIHAEVVPGVTSVTASSARAGLRLALSGERVAILPAAYIKDLKDVLSRFETVVLMKVHSVLPDVKKALAESGLLENAVYVCRAGLPGEIVKPLGKVSQEDLDYFSTVIVRRNGK
ncbi:MAG: precorrin-2 C(20)-methyltransferase [Nitrospiraceae bacterium]|nr:precorrin-2 C(20)-methyltransferase [Nitrospiraceae bacterium]